MFSISHDALKARHRALRDDFPQDFNLRIHRAISWVKRAEGEPEDPDAAFLFLWIAFNAAYAGERGAWGEKTAYDWFFRKLDGLDTEKRIYKAVWRTFPGPIRVLLDNPHVFGQFWHHQNGVAGYEDWERAFESARGAFHDALKRQDTAEVLSMLFGRLYVLRNQLVHGGATWNSSVNRDQLRDGARILGELVPIFIDLMMDHADEDWGKPFYPVVAS